MKLLLTDYVASLKERGELDAILPDLLSEIGFNVISRPAVGVVQHGVDIAAIRKNAAGERVLYLLSVKAGDLTRSEWNTGAQALRPSLDAIREVYIPHQAPEYRKLKTVIVLVVGGTVHQAAQSEVSGYIASYNQKRLSLEIWNGGDIADLLLTGLLREKFLPKPLQSSLQKAVAMVDQPDVSYDHFRRLVFALREQASTDKDRARAARQIYVCLWVLFIWGREIDNLDAPYRASELALLHVWEIIKPLIGKNGKHAGIVALVLNHLIWLHVNISGIILERRIFPYVDKHHALSVAVLSGEPTDVSLKMFETLGRVALTGYWMMWLAQLGGNALNDAQIDGLKQHVVRGLQLISNNPSLYSPLMEEQAIDIALFLSFAAQVGNANGDLRNWLVEVVKRIRMAVNTHGRYPAALRDYTDLINHPKAQTEEYREEVTPGSILLPLLLAWVSAFGEKKAASDIVALKSGPMAHCTFQLWLPDEMSEKHFYINDAVHGAALAELPISNDGTDLVKVVWEACQADKHLDKLTAMSAGYSPLILTACRHYRLPVPPHFWIAYLVPPDQRNAKAKNSLAPSAEPEQERSRPRDRAQRLRTRRQSSS